ncbi:hypothetical protein N7517_004706 [Penicillium concentricum]|uniref:F-box domain-containing protein n=1 Tax=Penicillium concentricum TaxID=293559 RepID=A0A9W9VAS8_9EURO|nr:uncharacterized protein N7517_004706 [Penicillium concentricum]KAJ5372700.1 hypothetical protein N7517_004706 [Penicillium concentricum]
MGGWSVYCAICGGPFSSHLDIDPEETDVDEFCYRDKVLRDCKLEWLEEVCGLGINPDAPGNDNYHAMDDPQLPHVFPFHPICYHGILQRCIQQENTGKLKGEVLVNVMEDLLGKTNTRLEVSYGEPEPPTEQDWLSIKGQEVLVVNPVEIPQLKAELDPITESLDKKATADQHSRSEDIFDRLPAELRNWVLKFLPVGSILALKAASLAMHTTSLSDGFWKHRLRSEIPWLWEIHDVDVFQSQVVEEKASNLLVDIEKKSQYSSENDDYIFGLANRRRIWGVCEQIRSQYLENLKNIPNTDSVHS